MEKEIRSVMKKLQSCSNSLKGIVLLANLTDSDSIKFSELGMEIDSIMSDLEDFLNDAFDPDEYEEGE